MLRLPTATVDLDTLLLQRDGVEHLLTQQEADLLSYLADSPTGMATREELLTNVLGYAPQVVTRAIDATVSRLRAKLERDPRKPQSLLSVRGKGYALRVVEQPAAPPLPATPATGHVLGRETERSAATQALTDHGVVQLVGPGGAGKTTLARLLCSDQAGAFIDLSAARSVDEVPTAIARALHLPLSRDSSQASLTRIAGVLRASGQLLVLDNLEQLPAEVTPLVQHLQQTSGAPLLLTSRRPIVDAWPKVTLGPMGPAQARALLVRTARSRAPTWSADPDEDLDDLAAAVDRLPLALELIGARLPVLQAKELLPRLRSLIHMGDGRQGRHATLASTVAWSWSMLGALDRRRLAWWSTFRGAVPLDAAEQIGPHLHDGRWGDGPVADDSVFGTIMRLQNASLLDPSTQTGLRPWVAVRAFVAEQLTDRGEREAAETAHANWLCSQAPTHLDELSGEAAREAVEWVLDHRADLTAAVERLAKAQPDQAVQLGLVWLLAGRRMVLGDVNRMEAMLLRAAARCEDPILGVEARLASAGRARHRRGDHTKVLLDECREVLDGIDGGAIEARYHSQLANWMRRHGEPEEALEHYERAHVIAEAHGLRRRLAMIQADHGSCLNRLGHHDEAWPVLMSAAAAQQALDNPRLEAFACQTLSAVARSLHHLEDALRLGERSIAASRRSKDLYTLSEALGNHGIALICMGYLDASEAHFREAIEIQRSISNQVALCFALGNLGAALEARGVYVEAELAVREAWEVAVAADVPFAAAFWRLRIAQLAHMRGNMTEALAGYELAIEELRANHAAAQLHFAHAYAAIAYAQHGDLPRARQLLELAAPLREGTDDDRAVVGMATALTARHDGASDTEALAELAALGHTLDWVASQPLLGPLLRLWNASLRPE